VTARSLGTKWKITLLLMSLIIISILILTSPWFQRRIYPVEFVKDITKYADQFGVDPYLVMAVIYVESYFDASACSYKGAVGLMQIMPKTGEWVAQRLKIKDFTSEKLYKPDMNIRIGCWYLSNLQSQFNGDLDLVLAAYNGGSGNVRKWLKNREYSLDGKTISYIPFKETREYVQKVKKAYKKYRSLYDLGSVDGNS
jgi:soluble lytic murein transglycosylase